MELSRDRLQIVVLPDDDFPGSLIHGQAERRFPARTCIATSHLPSSLGAPSPLSSALARSTRDVSAGNTPKLRPSPAAIRAMARLTSEQASSWNPARPSRSMGNGRRTQG